MKVEMAKARELELLVAHRARTGCLSFSLDRATSPELAALYAAHLIEGETFRREMLRREPQR